MEFAEYDEGGNDFIYCFCINKKDMNDIQDMITNDNLNIFIGIRSSIYILEKM